MKPIRIAVTKGRLEKGTIGLFDKMGFDTAELVEKGRRLILPVYTPDKKAVEVVLSKSADVITYVNHRVCDLGIVGKDTIAEYGGGFYEVVDLGFAGAGLCSPRRTKPIFMRVTPQKRSQPNTRMCQTPFLKAREWTSA